MKRVTALHPRLLLRHTLVRNTLSLMGVQAATYVVPLLTIPYLTRVLGPEQWGLVAFSQAFGAFAVLLGEYGFALSATREIARNREHPSKLADIVAGVLGARAILAAITLSAAIVARSFVPVFRQYPVLLWAAMFWGLAQAFSMMWFFQGLECMHVVAALEIGSRLAGATAIFIFVRSPRDAFLVLMIQGIAFSLNAALCLVLTYRKVVFHLPSWNSTWRALQFGWSMFLFKSSVTFYASANAFILGLFVRPQLVGYYAAAEKISRASLGLLGPISQSLYPRLAHLIHNSRLEAVRLARTGFAIMGSGGLVLGGLIYLMAPLLIRVIVGHQFEPAVPVLRILALLPPLIALSHVFGTQWMLPLGIDGPFNVITMAGGLVNIAMAVLLAPRFGDPGMAWAVVLAEAVVASGIYVVLKIRRLDPESYAIAVADPVRRTEIASLMTPGS